MAAKRPKTAEAGRPRRLGCFVTGLLGCSGFTIGALIAAAVFAPRLLGGTATKVVKRMFSEDVAGRVEIRRVDLAWTRPMRIHDLQVMDDSGRELLMASMRMPSLLDYFLGEPTDELVYHVEVRQADLERGSDGRWNLERVLGPALEQNLRTDRGARTWEEALSDLGRKRGVRLVVQTRGSAKVRVDGLDLDVEQLDASFWASANNVGVKTNLRATAGPRNLRFDAHLQAARSARDWTYALLDVEGSQIPAGWIEPRFQGRLADLECFGEVHDLELRAESPEGQTAEFKGRIQGARGNLDVEGRLENGVVLIEGEDALRYSGQPLPDGEVSRRLVPGLRAFPDPTRELSLACSRAYVPLFAPRDSLMVEFHLDSLGAMDGAQAVLLEPRSWRVTWGRDARGFSIEAESGVPEASRIYAQVRGRDREGDLRETDWEGIVIHADHLPVGVLSIWTERPWAERWLGTAPRLDFFSDRNADGWEFAFEAVGEAGRLAANGHKIRGQLVGGEEGSVELTGPITRLRHVALSLLPVYSSLEPTAESQARIALSGYEVPGAWLLDDPSAWNWAEPRAEVDLAFGRVELTMAEALGAELSMPTFPATLDVRVGIEGGQLRSEALPLGVEGKAHSFSGRIDLEDHRLDLNGKGTLSFVLGKVGRQVPSSEVARALSLPLHIGGQVGEPRVDLPLQTKEMAQAMEGIFGLVNAVQGGEARTRAPEPVPAPSAGEAATPRVPGGGE